MVFFKRLTITFFWICGVSAAIGAAWTGGGSGSGWNTAANWSTSGAPTTSVSAVISTPNLKSPLISATSYAYEVIVGQSSNLGTCQLDMTGGSLTLASGQSLYLGYNSGGVGVMNLSGGTVSMPNGGPRVGWSGTGTLNMTGGSMSSLALINIGTYSGSVGVMNVSGGMIQNVGWLATGYFGNGTLNVSGTAVINLGTGGNGVGWNAGSTGLLKISGGQYTALNTFVGMYGNGRLEMTGGTMSVTEFFIALYSGASGHVQLDGGTINVSMTFTIRQNNAANLGTMDITGGQLILTGNKQGAVEAYARSGWITAYGGAGAVRAYYDAGQNKTFVWAEPQQAAVAPRGIWQPSPFDRQFQVDGTTPLTWRVMPDAAQHLVFLGANGNAIADAEWEHNPADLSDTLSVDLTDAAMLASAWMAPASQLPKGDFNKNGVIDLPDLAALAEQWLWRGAAYGLYRERTGGAAYTPPLLTPNTTYYWRIDEVVDDEIIPGAMQRFTTRPIDARQTRDPRPAHGAQVRRTAALTLIWTPGATVTAYDVYLGVDAEAVAAAEPVGGVYRGRIATTQYPVAETLINGQTYYWRVDAVAGQQTHRGRVWAFTAVDGTLDRPVTAPRHLYVIAAQRAGQMQTDLTERLKETLGVDSADDVMSAVWTNRGRLTAAEMLMVQTLQNVTAHTQPEIFIDEGGEQTYLLNDLIDTYGVNITYVQTVSLRQTAAKTLLAQFAFRCAGFVRCDITNADSTAAARLLADILGGVAMDVQLETAIGTMSLPLLADTRGKTVDWVITHYGHLLEPTSAFYAEAGAAAQNLSVYAAMAQFDPAITLTQNRGTPPQPAGAPVHYATFLIGTSTAPQAVWDNADTLRYNLSFAAGRLLPPILAQLAPSAVRWLYDRAELQDSVTAWVFGADYLEPFAFAAPPRHAGQLASLLQKGDFRTVCVLDTVAPASLMTAYAAVVNVYTQQTVVRGLFYADAGGKLYDPSGRILWFNGKPMAICRFILKNDAAYEGVSRTGLQLAAVLNSLPTNPANANAYSVVWIDPAGGGLAEAAKAVGALNAVVRVVSPETFIEMIRLNNAGGF